MVLGSDWRNAVDVVSNKCMKIKDLNTQTACITGATEVLIRSTDLPTTLEGLKVYNEKWGLEVTADRYNEIARWMNQNRKKLGRSKSITADFILSGRKR
jgi:hypothetical protein